MGQVLKQDKIGTLSHNAGAINLAASILTIGGQQYSTSNLTRTISADLTMAANTRYQIYAVLVAGVPALRISVNENSVGPSGYSSWKLVGSFYADGTGSPAFGSFVNIDGVPITNKIPFIPQFTNLTVGNGTRNFQWSRSGDTINFRGALIWGSTTSASGTIYSGLPNGLIYDPAKFISGAALGLATGYDVGGTQAREAYIVKFLDPPGFYIEGRTDAGSSIVFNATSPVTWATGDYLQYVDVSISISGWNNTPIKDL